MPAPAMTDDGEALHKLVQNISHAWRSGHTGELNRYFHDDMVIVAPGLAQRCEGRAATKRHLLPVLLLALNFR